MSDCEHKIIRKSRHDVGWYCDDCGCPFVTESEYLERILELTAELEATRGGPERPSYKELGEQLEMIRSILGGAADTAHKQAGDYLAELSQSQADRDWLTTALTETESARAKLQGELGRANDMWGDCARHLEQADKDLAESKDTTTGIFEHIRDRLVSETERADKAESRLSASEAERVRLESEYNLLRRATVGDIAKTNQ